MRSGSLSLSFVVAAAFVLAGCLTAAGSGTAPVEESPRQGALSGEILRGAGCETSIGLSMVGPHFNDGTAMGLWGEQVGPFDLKDVKAYSGVQAVGIVGMVMVGLPGSGPSTGVWHSMSRCDQYETAVGTSGTDFGMGWISAYIDPPEWGEDGIDHHFFVVDMSFSDEALVKAVLDSTSHGLEINQAYEAEIGWPAPNLMHGRLHDAMHGLFEWQTPQKPAEPRESETIRFWMLVHESDQIPETHWGINTHNFREGMGDPANENRGNGEIEGTYYPVVFDVHHEAIPGQSIVQYPAESTGTFSHTEYCHHGHPQSAGHGHDHGDGGCDDDPSQFEGDASALYTDGGQTEAGLYWAGYDTTITLGPDYSDHRFDVTWIH